MASAANPSNLIPTLPAIAATLEQPKESETKKNALTKDKLTIKKQPTQNTSTPSGTPLSSTNASTPSSSTNARKRNKSKKSHKSTNLSLALVDGKEPLLVESVAYERWQFRAPTKQQNVWKGHIEFSRSFFWVTGEIEMHRDLNDWNSLDSSSRRLITYVLAFFMTADGLVMENLAQRFMSEVKDPYVRAYYAQQIAVEAIHGETYAELANVYFPNPKEFEEVANAIHSMPGVRKKAMWAQKWLTSQTTSFAERLVAFACVEGIFFSGSFCVVFFFKNQGKMIHGLGTSNEMIARDENSHFNFACDLYVQGLVKKLSKTRILEIVQECVNNEIEFIKEALPEGLNGMNATMMQQYIEFTADRLFVGLGHEKHYKSTNPFPFMENIDLMGKTNFFEKRVGDYQKSIKKSSATASTLSLSSSPSSYVGICNF